MKKQSLVPLAKCTIRFVRFSMLSLGVAIFLLCWLSFGFVQKPKKDSVRLLKDSLTWVAPDLKSIPENDSGKLIRYGRELILHTADYLGPQGKIKSISNGMNCTNCHLTGGTKYFGNNFSIVASTYPKFRPRFGTLQSIEGRINDCFERSLNGSPLDTTSTEMQAIVGYIRWLGQDVEKGTSPGGSGLITLGLLDRPANIEKGKLVYNQKCQVCHGQSGEGKMNEAKSAWLNPPLWGDQSYNNAAGMYRIGPFAAFIKTNMPLGAASYAEKLSDEEAWDVAAYVNSQPRPKKDQSRDWPDIAIKAVDYPYGPFIDNFDTLQHKYGPFRPILEFQEKLKQKNLQLTNYADTVKMDYFFCEE